MNSAPQVVNLGSLNLDRVLRVPTIVKPGETLAADALALFAGGKGLNQSVSLARAGVRVAHLGRIGADGLWLRDRLAAEGIDIEEIGESDLPTGQALIQVDEAGQNAIVILAGANDAVLPADVDRALSRLPSGGWLLAQNETSAVEYAIRRAKQLGLRTAYNPAPFNARAAQVPLELVDLLCVNETEGAELTGAADAEAMLSQLAARMPTAEILVTLGPRGVVSQSPQGRHRVIAPRVEPLDTTAAGDTFLGYYLAARLRGEAVADALAWACRAAALCVTRAGAMDSIPTAAEVAGCCS